MTKLLETLDKLEQIMAVESDPMKRYYYRHQLRQVLEKLESLNK